jgi:hypothetical protein
MVFSEYYVDIRKYQQSADLLLLEIDKEYSGMVKATRMPGWWNW